MLNRLLEYNYSAVVIFIIIGLLKLILFFTGQLDSGNYDDSLFAILPQIGMADALLSVLTTILLGVFILINSEKHAKRTDFSFWLVLIFALLMSFNLHFAFSVEYIGLFFFILSFFFYSKGIANINKSKSVISVFNLSLSLSIGTLFIPHLIYTLPLFLLCRVALGMESFRGLIATIIGFCVPFVIIDGFIFVFYQDVAQYTHLFILERLFDGNVINPLKFHSYEQFSALGPFIFLIYSLYLTFTKTYKMKKVVRNFDAINFIMLIYISITTLLGIIPTHFGIMLVFVPSAYFFSNLQALATPMWRHLFIWILLLSITLSYPPTISGIISLYEMIFKP